MSDTNALQCRREEFFDRRSLGPAVLGGLAAAIGVPAKTLLALNVLYEVTEQPLLDAAPDWFPHYCNDSFVTKVGDVSSAMLGWALVKVLMR